MKTGPLEQPFGEERLPENKSQREGATPTATGVHEVDGKVIGAVLDFELVEENAQHLRRRHAAVDANVGH